MAPLDNHAIALHPVDGNLDHVDVMRELPPQQPVAKPPPPMTQMAEMAQMAQEDE